MGAGDEARSATAAAAASVSGTTVGGVPVAVLVAALVEADVLAAAGRLWCPSIGGWGRPRGGGWPRQLPSARLVPAL